MTCVTSAPGRVGWTGQDPEPWRPFGPIGPAVPVPAQPPLGYRLSITVTTAVCVICRSFCRSSTAVLTSAGRSRA